MEEMVLDLLKEKKLVNWRRIEVVVILGIERGREERCWKR